MILPPGYSLERLEPYYRKVLSRCPEMALARHALARLYLDYARPAEAKAELETLMAVGRTTARTHELMAEAAFALKEYPTTIAHLEQVCDIVKRKPFLLAKLGLSYMHTERYDAALAVLGDMVQSGRAQKLSGGIREWIRESTIHEALGFCYLRTEQWSSAFEAYLRALADPSLSSESRDNIAAGLASAANAFAAKGRLDETESVLLAALDARPSADIERPIQDTIVRVREAKQRRELGPH